MRDTDPQTVGKHQAKQAWTHPMGTERRVAEGRAVGRPPMPLDQHANKYGFPSKDEVRASYKDLQRSGTVIYSGQVNIYIWAGIDWWSACKATNQRMKELKEAMLVL